MLRTTLLLVALVTCTGTATAAEQKQSSAQSPDGKRLALIKKNVIDIVEPNTGKVLISIRGHTQDISALEYTPNGVYLCSVDVSGKVNMFQANTGRLLRSIMSQKGITKISFTKDSKTMMLKTKAATQKFDVATGREIK